jgi:hypothetical protein
VPTPGADESAEEHAAPPQGVVHLVGFAGFLFLAANP